MEAKEAMEACPITPESNSNKEVICVEYPGVVQNTESMLETLGGTVNLCKVFSDKSRRMELRFRPEDPYCKPTCGTRSQSSNLLVRVKRVRVTKKCGKCDKSSQPKEEIRTEVLAPIQSTFTFNNLCDFQYLPTETTKVSFVHKTKLTNQINSLLEFFQDLETATGDEGVKSAKPKTFVQKPILDQVHFDKLVDAKW